MASTTFINGTVIQPDWLNDINATTYATVPSILTVTGLLAVSGSTLVVNTTEAIKLPIGTTAQRPSIPTVGVIRYNSDLSQYEGYGSVGWAPIGGAAKGGPNSQVFFENDISVVSDYTITTSKNAMTAGPITINNGVTITVPNGSVWTVV